MHFPTPGVCDGTVGATPSAARWSSAKLEQRITIMKHPFIKAMAALSVCAEMGKVAEVISS